MKGLVRPLAREDILRQYRYLLVEANSPFAAERFLREIQAAIKQICRRPGVGAAVRLQNPRLAGIRSWPVPGFAAIRVYYLVSEEAVHVVRVLHGKRDIASILENKSEQ